jgi:thymidine kinase
MLAPGFGQRPQLVGLTGRGLGVADDDQAHAPSIWRCRRDPFVGSRTVIRTVPGSGGWLEVICGPMFSGKSEELIRRLRRAEIAGQRVLIVKPRVDDRYDVSHVVSHAGAKMRAVAVASADDALRRADGYDAVGVDEVQFFEPAIVDAVRELVSRGTRVVAAGLDLDFRAEPFGAMPLLLCFAEFVDKLQAVCHTCGGPATRTQRLVDGEPAPFDGATIQIGALDSYEARCGACYRAGAPVSLGAVG